MEQSTSSLQEMDKLPVHTAVLKNILPSIGIFLMMLIYNYADLFFIGNVINLKNEYQILLFSDMKDCQHKEYNQW